MNVIADFRKTFAVDILDRQAAVADEFAGLLQDHSPQAEAVFPVVLEIPLDPVSGALFVKGLGVVLHGFRVGQDLMQGVEILPFVFPQCQACGFNHRFPTSIIFRFSVNEHPS